MSLTNTGLALVGIFIGSTIYSLWSTIKFVKHRIDINNEQKNGSVLVEGSLQRDNAPIIVTVAVLVILLGFMLSRRKFYSLNPVMTVTFGLYVLDNILVIIKLVLNILQGEICYLTTRGLVTFDMSADWPECRFAWEAPAVEGGISNTLYAYKNESKVPIIIRFNYKYDEAHKAIDRFALGVRYTGYMEEEEFKTRPKVTDGKVNS